MNGVIVIEAKVVSSHGGDVVGLRRVGLRIVLCQEDAFPFQVGKVGLFNRFGEILFGDYQSG